MLRCLFAIIFVTIFNDLASQIVVNEIVFANDSILKIEIFNKSAKVINIKSVNLTSDTFQITRELSNYAIQPSELSLMEFELSDTVSEFSKVSIRIITDYDQYATNFNGSVLLGESAGRYPDIVGEFVIYTNLQISPGKSNNKAGILVKKTSKTKFSPRDSSPNAALYFNSHYWILGGWDYNEESDTFSSKANIWKSEDGVDWSLVNDNPPFSHYSTFVVFNNKMMVLYNDTVFFSDDGLSWEKYRINPVWAAARYIVFKNKLYWFGWNLMGESSDGINWTITPTNFPCDEIPDSPALVSSGDRLWIYGGTCNNSVWTSSDGLFWDKVLDEAPWSPRKWFNYTYFDNKLWMIAGNDETKLDDNNFGNLRDFWYSSDGAEWNLLETDTTFCNRHGSFLWNDGKRILISSGFGNNSVSRMYNDVWELGAAITLSSPESTKGQTFCINTPLKDIEYIIKGVTGATVSGLPEGVTGSYTGDLLRISGTPTVSGTFNYTVTLMGYHDLPHEAGAITVSPDATIALTSESGNNLQTLCINTPLKDIGYKITGGTTATVSGLPSGVLGSYSEDKFTISGAPTISGTFNYTVTTTGPCSTATSDGTLTVNPDANIFLSSAPGTDEQFLCMNTQLRNITYTVLNSTGATISGLPQGLQGTYKDDIFTISGFSTLPGDYNYHITATGLCKLSTAAGTIKVNEAIVFPNPTNGTLKIPIKNQFSIRIFNMAGNQIFLGTYVNDNNIFEKDFSGVFQSNGLFLIVIKDFATGQTFSQKIVVVL